MTNKTYLGIGETGPPGPPGAVGPPGIAVNYRGDWDPARTYMASPDVQFSEAVTGSNGHDYVTKASGNLNHDPVADTTETYWHDLFPPYIRNKNYTYGPIGVLAADTAVNATQVVLQEPIDSLSMIGGGVFLDPRTQDAEYRAVKTLSPDKRTVTLRPQRALALGHTRVNAALHEWRWCDKIKDIRVTLMPDYSIPQQPVAGTLQITLDDADALQDSKTSAIGQAGGFVTIFGTKNYNRRKHGTTKRIDADGKVFTVPWYGPYGIPHGGSLTAVKNPADWLVGTTYAATTPVRDPGDGLYYYSLTAGNIGNTPHTSPAFWTLYTPSLGTLAAGTYAYQATVFNDVGETPATAELTVTTTATGKVQIGRYGMPQECGGIRVYARASGAGKHKLGDIPNVGFPFLAGVVSTGLPATIPVRDLQKPIPLDSQLVISGDPNVPAIVWTVSTAAAAGDAVIHVTPDRPVVQPIPVVAAYDDNATYNTGDKVSYVGLTFVSRQDNNQGNQPDVSPHFWSPDAGPWDVATEYDQDETVTYGGQTYSSLKDLNIGNQPDTSPTWWKLIKPPGNRILAILVDDGNTAPSGATPPTANTTGNLPAETAPADWAIGDAWMAGSVSRFKNANFRPGAKFVVSGSDGGHNDGVYTVATVDLDGCSITTVEAPGANEFDLQARMVFTWNLQRPHTAGGEVLYAQRTLTGPELWGIKADGTDEGWMLQNAFWDNASVAGEMFHPPKMAILTSIPIFGSDQSWRGVAQASQIMGIAPQAWVNTTGYRGGMRVADNGHFWRALADNTNQRPSTSPSYWQDLGVDLGGYTAHGQWSDNGYGTWTYVDPVGHVADLGRMYFSNMQFTRPPGPHAYGVRGNFQQPCTWDGRIRINGDAPGSAVGYGECLVLDGDDFRFGGYIELIGGRIGLSAGNLEIVDGDLDVEQQWYAGIYAAPYSGLFQNNKFRIHSEESGAFSTALVLAQTQIKRCTFEGYWAPGGNGAAGVHLAPLAAKLQSTYRVDLQSLASTVCAGISDYDMKYSPLILRCGGIDFDRAEIKFEKFGQATTGVARDTIGRVYATSSGHIIRLGADEPFQPAMIIQLDSNLTSEFIRFDQPPGTQVAALLAGGILQLGPITIQGGAGSPSGAVTATAGSMYLRSNGTWYQSAGGTVWNAVTVP